MTTTFVVACEGKGNWTVEDNNGAADGPFQNWVKAMDFARDHAVTEGADIVRLSAKDGRVVEVVKPRVKHARKALSVVVEPVVKFDDVPAETETLTEDSLNALPTPALVAVYNANGGNITGKFKGARKTLVTKILANVA